MVMRSEPALYELASCQHGLITCTQALGTGLSHCQIEYRLRSGAWISITRGVYRIAGSPGHWRQSALAACLAPPGVAVASHLTAAALHGLRVSAPPVPQVTVPYGSSARSPIAEVHRARHGVSEQVTIDRVPTTTLDRTLIDCAALLGPIRLRKLTDAALHSGRTRPGRVDDGWDDVRDAPGRAGERKLRATTGPWHDSIAADSPAEVRLQRLVVQWGFPPPEAQIPVTDAEGSIIARIDLGWSSQMVGIEYDSDRWHGPSAWAEDESRHRAIEAQGWTLLHADKSDLRAGSIALRKALERAWPSPKPQ